MKWIPILYFLMWIIIALVFLLLLIVFLPLNVDISNQKGEFEIKFRIWFLRLDRLRSIFSKFGGKKKKSKKSGKSKIKYKEIVRYSKLILKNIGKLLRFAIKNIKFKRLNLKICVGGEDASKVAIEYGEICSVFYPLARVIVDINNPKNYSLAVVLDFVSDKIRIDTDISLRTSIFNILMIVINMLKIMKSDLK